VRLRIASLLFLSACLAVPAAAQTLYSNGPVNGTTDAWTITDGFVVSDTFNLSNASTVTGLSFGVWLDPGDTLLSSQVEITSSEFGGTIYSNQMVSFTADTCSDNQDGFKVCLESSTNFAPVNLAAGVYWLSLQNALTEAGEDDPIYWDENSGPSSASENSVGTIPSESFTVFGTTGTSTTSTTSTTPEPSSVMLLGSGVLAMAGVIRRKLL
jgi:PEP-CTERM motif